MEKQEIINKLKSINADLATLQVEILEKNKNGHQFDFCTDPALSTACDNLLNKAKRINQIVYQEK